MDKSLFNNKDGYVVRFGGDLPPAPAPDAGKVPSDGHPPRSPVAEEENVIAAALKRREARAGRRKLVAIKLPLDVIVRVQRFSADWDITIQDITERALTSWLDRQEAGAGLRR